MSERQTVNTNIRLNLAREDDRRAWEYLQRMDRTRFKSYSRAVVASLNDFFLRQERLADNPYLETREKEDAFLMRVPGYGLKISLQSLQEVQYTLKVMTILEKRSQTQR